MAKTSITKALAVPLAAVVFALPFCCVQTAGAAFMPQQRIDGPDPAILEISDVAVSQDGNGGLVYRKTVDGADHVFASIYREGAWSAPQRVDDDQVFRSSSPRIGAADGGRLVITWVQENGPNTDRLYSASLDPGATVFEPPVALDINVGEAQYVQPDLAMNRAGVAYIVYRIVTNQIVTGLPDYIESDYRVARYNGWTWSRIDQPVDRNQGAFVPAPTADNGPKIAADGLGNAVVAFQEPDDEFISRVWARRLFGSTLGIALMVSPSTYQGQPLRAAADQISIAGGHYGNAAIAVRQDPGPQMTLDKPRVFVNQIPDLYSADAAKFLGARLADNSGGGASASPTVAVNARNGMLTMFSSGGEIHSANGDEATLSPSAPLGTATGDAVGADISGTLRSAGAWIAPAADGDQLVLREDNAADAPAAVAVRDGAGGAVETMTFAGSGYGDALTAFSQAAPEGRVIAAAGIDSSPARFAVHEDEGWSRARNVVLGWDPAIDVFGGAMFEVRANGRLIATTRDLSLATRALRDGRTTIKLTAIDRMGQRTEGIPATVAIDRRKPSVRIKRAGSRRIKVIFRDGPRRKASGASSRSKVSWGDGKSSRLRRSATHKYRRGGTVKLRLRLRDKAGNSRVVTRRIKL